MSGEEELQPDQGMALGACKVMPHEYASLICRNIDIVKPTASSREQGRLTAQLIEELRGTWHEPVVAYRGRYRWVQTYEAVRVESDGNGRGRLRPGGVYLITGGIGRIGLEVAAFLCREAKAKVALVGHSCLAPRKQWEAQSKETNCPAAIRQTLERLMDMQRGGGEVWVEAADITDEAQMRDAVRRVKDMWGRLDGVIHAAGVSPEKSLRQMSEADCADYETQFRTKVFGAAVLERVLEGEELDFCFLMSSVTAVLGGAGFAALAAASQFGDTFARAHNQRSEQKWTSVNWDRWDFGDGENEVERFALKPDEAVEAFARLLEMRHAEQVVVSSGDLAARIEQSNNRRPRREEGESEKVAKGPQHQRPELSSSYEAARDELEEQIVRVWEELLGIGSIGVTDNFFELGGHSLLAMQLVSRIRSKLGVDVALRRLFDEPTVSGLAEAIREQINAGVINEGRQILPVGREHLLPLSYAQQRLWFIHQLEPDSAAYNMPSAIRLRGPLDILALQQSLQEIVRRHVGLADQIETLDGRPLQVIDEMPEVAFPVWDVSGLAEDEREKWARRIAGQEGWRPFDLKRGPVCRAALARLGLEDHFLLLCLHHVASDGWSVGVMVKEFTSLYEAYREGRKAELPELAIQYADYAVWQREWLQGELLEQQLAYWRRQLTDVPVLELPTDRPRPPIASHRGSKVGFALSADLTRDLKEMSQREEVTLFMMLLAGLQIVLGRCAGQDDVAIGTDVANRNRVETEGLIGFFVNQLVLRTNLSGNPSFRELLRRVREVTLAAYSHQDLPFEKLVEELTPARDLSRSPLFQIKLVLQNVPQGELRAAGVDFNRLAFDSEAARFDMTLALVETKDSVIGITEYATDLFNRSSIEQLLERLRLVLAAMVEDADRRIGEIVMLTAYEQQQVLVEWNDMERDFGNRPCVHEMFEEQTDASPDAIALICQHVHLSYASLNDRANRLANYLSALGVAGEVRVAICMKRSPDLIIAILGVLKAGGCYVPIDANNPEQRISYMLDDCGAEVVLTESEIGGRLPSGRMQVIEVDTEEEEISKYGGENPTVEVEAESGAYMIYTSGSTGRPKAVIVTHAGFKNLSLAQRDIFGPLAGAVVLQFSSIGFDASAWEIAMSLPVGAKLVLSSDETMLAGDGSKELIEREQVEVATIPPSVLGSVFGMERGRLKTLVVAGEACSDELVQEWAVGRCMLDAYGPTETTVCATVSGALRRDEKPMIGRPIANARAYVLDRWGQLAPAGSSGELYVGGAGLARGYWKQAEQTAESFVPDWLSGQEGARLYRTGDQVKWRPNGELQYLGRLDQQIKVRGYRIELGEIESLLAQHEHVRTVRRLPQTGSTRQLSPCCLLRSLCHQHCLCRPASHLPANKLPAYMIPSAFVALSILPVTSNGKLDRKALPEPAYEVVEDEEQAASSAVEEIIAGIWAEVMKVGRVGVNENFFEKGGHSLLATQVVSRVREAMGVEVGLREMFEHPTVRGLAQVVERGRRGGREIEALPIEAGSREGLIPLSYAQQRLWFINQLEPDSTAYNIPYAVRLQGTLNISVLQQSMEEIVRRHESLRIRFESKNGQPAQVIEVGEINVQLWDLTDLDEAEREQQGREIVNQHAQRPFDLEHGPVWRTTLVRLGPHDHLLLLCMHHIVSDAWSMGILVNEFSQLYDRYCQGRQVKLPELAIQYADYAVWQRQWLQGDVLDQQLAYWRQQLAAAPVLELPTDRPRPAVATHRGAAVGVRLSADLTDQLKQLSRREGVTMFMTLMAGLRILLWRYSGQHDISIGTPIANRNRVETEGLIGFLANTLVMRKKMSVEATVSQMLSEEREVALGGYANQDVPYERVVEEMKPERSMSREAMFQVMMILQNAPAEDSNLSNLRISSEPMEATTAKFDMTLFLAEVGGQLRGWLEYASDLYDRERMQRMEKHLRTVLGEMASDSSRRLADISLLSEQERQQVLVEWNGTVLKNPTDKCVHEIFEQQVERTPEAVAVVYEEQQLTYRELNRRANRLAHSLRRMGVGAEVRVALNLERSLDMVVGVLGVLKAGGAYVPLDPAYPSERLAYMTEDSQAWVVVTQKSLMKGLSENPAKVLSLELESEQKEIESEDNPESVIDPENIAYVIYTSGSTGKPKGIALSHGALSNLINWHHLTLPGDSRILQFASLSFDASFHEIFSALCFGGTLFIVEESLRMDASGLARYVSEVATNKLILPVVVLHQLAERYSEDTALLAGVEELITTGEQLNITRPVIDLFSRLRDTTLHNHYGPSESHVVTSFTLTRFPESWPSHPSIGRPIFNTQTCVLDCALSPAPVGALGEIFIGGVALARGYLNRPDLTAEKFIPNPHGSEPGERAYRTGDVGFYLSDGNIQYLGRADNQVKIRGFRVELGEIEAIISQYAGVQECLVLVREDAPGDKRLVAYIVTSGLTEMLVSELRNHLRSKLPEYMIPSAFVLLERFPLTPNGKVDRRALPGPENQRPDQSVAFVPPRNLSEEIVADIWSSILGVEQVGIFDNFFDLGGHSLLATQVISHVRDLFQVAQLPLRRIFETPTVAGLVEAVAQIWGSLETVEEIAQTIYQLQHLSPDQMDEILKAGGQQI